jgi:hypothetical protein
MNTKDKKSKKSKKPNKKKERTFNINTFIGKQLARLRFGVTYIQMLYYASVILAAVTLVIDNIFGEGIIGWLDSLIIIIAIFIIEWGLGYYTDKTGIVKKDRTQGFIQNIPANKLVQGEVWKEAIIPQLEVMFEKVLTKTLGNLAVPQMEEIVEEVKKQLQEEKK